MTEGLGFPAGRRVALDDRVRVWPDASVVLGGAPWGVLRIAPAARDFVRRLAAAGAGGAAPSPGGELAVANLLLARGIVHPVATAERTDIGAAVDVVVPAYGGPALLDACLISLRQASPLRRIVVVDDASPSTDSPSTDVGSVARRHGATVLRHDANRGPAAARNTGLRESDSAIVAFVDADCVVTPGWLEPLLAHFDDPRVAAVAPRILPRSKSRGPLARYSAQQSALDMGSHPELVTYGAPLGFVPSAAVLVRRSALDHGAFDEALRLGEDVDLVWRLTENGGLVRYEPESIVTHELRPTLRSWAARVFDYGTSAPALDRRHPGRLRPARFSGWNVMLAVLLVARRPGAGTRAAAAVGVAGLASALLARSLTASSVDPRVAPVVVGRTMTSDAQAVGHLLRREWWPVGWTALLGAFHSRSARAAAAAMLLPLVGEWRRRRPDLDLPRYLALRLVEDAAYGSGVIAAAVRDRRPAVLLPRVRLPYLKRRKAQKKPTALSL